MSRTRVSIIRQILVRKRQACAVPNSMERDDEASDPAGAGDQLIRRYLLPTSLVAEAGGQRFLKYRSLSPFILIGQPV